MFHISFIIVATNVAHEVARAHASMSCGGAPQLLLGVLSSDLWHSLLNIQMESSKGEIICPEVVGDSSHLAQKQSQPERSH